MNSIIKKPIFWGGVALITFAYFTAKGSRLKPALVSRTR